MPDTAVIPAQMDAVSKPMGFQFVSLAELSDEQKQVLKDTVALGTTDTQLTYFLNVALSQDLDPFKKEVWCILYNGKLTIQTGRDGLLKVAKRDPTFDRIQSAEVREGDTFTMDPVTGQVEHRLTAKRGQILGAWAKITRRDGTSVTKYVTFSEYNDPSSPVWKEYPTALICKCAESVLCKQFANVTGIVAEETMRKDGTVIDSSPTAQAQASTLADDLVKKIEACTTPAEFGKVREEVAGVAGKLFGPEKEKVFAAAKKKKAELEPAATVVSTPIVATTSDVAPVIDATPTDMPQESHSDATPKDAEMPLADFTSWLEGLPLQETESGLKDLAEAFYAKPSTPAQKAVFEGRMMVCVQELQPKSKPSKKKAA